VKCAGAVQVVTTFSTDSSRPALRAAACGGRPRAGSTCRSPRQRGGDVLRLQPITAQILLRNGGRDDLVMSSRGI
jgi:hypothetical protein